MPVCDTCKSKPALVTVVIFDANGREVLHYSRLCQRCLSTTKFTASITPASGMANQPGFHRPTAALRAEYF